MNELVSTSNQMPAIKVWNGQRVVTFRDIDEVHNRVSGTARRNFKANKKHFIEDEDFFTITREKSNGRISSNEKSNGKNFHIGNIPPKGITVLTESGYLMIAKSFTDDLAWDVQRKLVNNYFRSKDQQQADVAVPVITLHSKTQLPPVNDWFKRNNGKMYEICEKYGFSRKQLYHKILIELGESFDMEMAKAIYIQERGYEPTFAMNIVYYFPQLADRAEKYIDYLLES